MYFINKRISSMQAYPDKYITIEQVLDIFNEFPHKNDNIKFVQNFTYSLTMNLEDILAVYPYEPTAGHDQQQKELDQGIDQLFPSSL